MEIRWSVLENPPWKINSMEINMEITGILREYSLEFQDMQKKINSKLEIAENFWKWSDTKCWNVGGKLFKMTQDSCFNSWELLRILIDFFNGTQMYFLGHNE